MTCPSKLSLVNLETPKAAEPARFWRSIDELAGDPQFNERLAHEFTRFASVLDSPTDRRRFIQLMAASMALAGMNGCSSPPPEPILPYVRSPSGSTAGIPRYFATAAPRASGAVGLVATSHQGRPTKVDGNPQHPASLGATDARTQASVLTLYDPDRSQTTTRNGEIATWDGFLGFIREATTDLGDGAGFHLLSRPSNSPTLLRQRAALLEKFPAATWHEYVPGSARNSGQGAEIAFGQVADPVYRLADADVVVSLDSNFLVDGGGALLYSRDFMARRGYGGTEVPNRLYVIESSFTPTGAAADHRLALPPSQIADFAVNLAARLGIGEARGSSSKWIDAVATDLESNRGRCLVLAGEQQPPYVHALVHAINDALGAAGSTVEYIEPISPSPPGVGSLSDLVESLNGGAVQLLLVLDANPVYDASNHDFATAIRKARSSVHFGLYHDETAALCTWHVPAAHYLESWSDGRAYDGTAAIIQPLIAPLYGGKTPHDLLSTIIDEQPASSYNLVRDTWTEILGEEFERGWHEALSAGFIANSAFEPLSLSVDGNRVTEAVESSSPANGSESGDAFELAIIPDPSIGCGEDSNNAWLQELPKPLTKLTWENAVLLSPADARRLGVSTGDVVKLDFGNQEVSAPVCILPGHPQGSVTCHLGYGRTRAGRNGTAAGFNAFLLLGVDSENAQPGVRITRTGRRHELAITQVHHVIDGRNIVHSATIEQYDRDPKSVLPESAHHEHPSFYPEDKYEGFAWGMAIDLSKCMGCNGCVVACQAENNVPVVGKDQVIRGREMHWLRMDLYYAGSQDEPEEAIHQPMLCQHCEKAPCEVVCPVAATSHSDEGLNEMTYNRCIGTRYCSNNCPYKVRRFNFFQSQDETTPVLKLLRNPEVTVRSRGVMEKCTYCVQRIDHARIGAKKAALDSGQPPAIEDGSLQTACQQACSTQAIVFGDINNPNSLVSQMKADPRNYGVIAETGTQPRTTYLVRMRNPNPQWTEGS